MEQAKFGYSPLGKAFEKQSERFQNLSISDRIT